MNTAFIYALAAILCAALIAFTTTPAVRVFAFKINAVDIPKDNRRMHKNPIPQVGGLAIFFGFLVTTMIFCPLSPEMAATWAGSAVILVGGVLDDIYSLKPWQKLLFQFGSAAVAVFSGFRIDFIQLFGHYVSFGLLSVPLTLLWIVGMTNAINLIDGLDGLSCGVSAICSTTLMIIMFLKGDTHSAMITAAIVGACLGFLPFNANPASIFMGDTGAMFLGYIMALLSIEGLFKFHTVVSFLIPLSIFGLPLFDTGFAFFRRILHGKSPFSSDRGHIHHRLIDMGFNQKNSVRILYAICGILGIASVLLSLGQYIKAAIVIAIGFLIFGVNALLLKNPAARAHFGMDLEAHTEEDEHEERH